MGVPRSGDVLRPLLSDSLTVRASADTLCVRASTPCPVGARTQTPQQIVKAKTKSESSAGRHLWLFVTNSFLPFYCRGTLVGMVVHEQSPCEIRRRFIADGIIKRAGVCFHGREVIQRMHVDNIGSDRMKE